MGTIWALDGTKPVKRADASCVLSNGIVADDGIVGFCTLGVIEDNIEKVLTLLPVIGDNDCETDEIGRAHV